VAEDDDLERRVRKLAVEHAETRWLTLRLDDDVKEIRTELRGINRRLDSIDSRLDSVDGRLDAVENRLTEHGARFDSVDGQLRSLTRLVGQVLERLPEEPRG
jgi:chromosome segregation ATPase